MADLRSKIAAIAAEFAEKIVEAITSGTLEDISALAAPSVGRPSEPLPESRPPRGRRPRRAKKGSSRAAPDVDKIVESILTVLKLHPEGLRSVELQKALGLSKHELPLARALEKELAWKTGKRHLTRYFAS